MSKPVFELWELLRAPPELVDEVCLACGQTVPAHRASYSKLRFPLTGAIDGLPHYIDIPVINTPEGRQQAEKIISILKLKVSA